MNISLRQLHAFIAVAKLGSFTEAANSLHVTQSALSSLIKELEKTLGVRLFDRGTRHVELSDIGREFFPLAGKVVDDLSGAMREIINLREMRRGVVRIAAPQLMSCTVLPPVILAFRERHPNVEVRLIDCAIENALARVASGEVDFCVGPKRNGSIDLDSDPLLTAPIALVIPPRHPMAKKQSVSWKEALTFPFVVQTGEFTDRLALDLHAWSPDLRVEPVHEVSYMTTLFSLVATGLGVAVAPTYAEPFLHTHELEMRPLLEPAVSRSFHIFYKKGRSLSPAAEGLRTALLASLPQPRH